MGSELSPERAEAREQYRATVMKYVTREALADTGIVYPGGYEDEPEGKN